MIKIRGGTVAFQEEVGRWKGVEREDKVCRRIDCEQLRSRINQQLIAGRFSHEAYKLKNCRVRLGRYSNQICFQCASQATTCQQMDQIRKIAAECVHMDTKERQRKDRSGSPTSQSPKEPNLKPI